MKPSLKGSLDMWEYVMTQWFDIAQTASSLLALATAIINLVSAIRSRRRATRERPADETHNRERPL